jgi:hypothetical protein
LAPREYNLSIPNKVYLDEIKGLSDEMAAAGKLLDNLDVISHILSGLDEEYDGFVAAITALIKAEKNVSLSDVYSQFMSYEARMESKNLEMVHQLTR